MTGEVFDVDGDRKLGSGFGTCPRHSQEASVGIVALEEGGDLRRDRLDFRRVLGYPAREQLHRPVLGGDGRRVRPGRGGQLAQGKQPLEGGVKAVNGIGVDSGSDSIIRCVQGHGHLLHPSRAGSPK